MSDCDSRVEECEGIVEDEEIDIQSLGRCEMPMPDLTFVIEEIKERFAVQLAIAAVVLNVGKGLAFVGVTFVVNPGGDFADNLVISGSAIAADAPFSPMLYGGAALVANAIRLKLRGSAWSQRFPYVQKLVG